jgi:hypothetical protein
MACLSGDKVSRAALLAVNTRPRSRLVPGARVERACPAFQAGALTATASLANLVEEEGIEPFDQKRSRIGHLVPG